MIGLPPGQDAEQRGRGRLARMRQNGTRSRGRTGTGRAGNRYDGAVPAYVVRAVDPLIDRLLTELPALFIIGPRATGKTTTAARHARTVIRLDREAEAVAFRADPDAALRGLVEPVLLDEWQAVPGVLGAVKRAIDSRPDPGRFIVTGSVRGDLEAEVWPGTGRLTRVPMYGMTLREQFGESGHETFFDRVVRNDDLRPAPDTPDLRGYVELMLRSGFPEAALRLSESARRRWLESYVDQLLTHDVEQVDARRDPARLRRYVEAYALNTAGIVEDKAIYDSAGIDRKTALAYERLLTSLLVIDALPAWTTNRLKRLVLSPKRYVVDGALVASILRLDATAILRDGDVLGRLLDTFVFRSCGPTSWAASPDRAFITCARNRVGLRSISSANSAAVESSAWRSKPVQGRPEAMHGI